MHHHKKNILKDNAHKNNNYKVHGRRPNLHGGVLSDQGVTFQVLVATATGTPPEWHAGGVVDVAHPCRWVLLAHLHQLLHQVTQAAVPQI